MNRVKTNLTFTAELNDRLMWYSVAAGTSVIFRGKAYVLGGTSTLTLDLTDLVSGYIYKGYGVLNPTWVADYNGYQQPWTGLNDGGMHSTPADGTNDEYHISSLTTKLYTDSTFTTQIATSTLNGVYFHSIAPQDRKGGTSHGGVVYYYNDDLVPHLPKIATNNLLYGQLVYNSNVSSSLQSWCNAGGVYIASYVILAGKSITYSMNLRQMLQYTYTDNKLYNYVNASTQYPILVFDECPKPYYLLWLNPNGGFQSLGFNGSSVYTEKHTVNMRLTYDDYSYKANQTLTSEWQLKSGLVTDSQYQCIASAARSPYCLLYITDLDRSILVNVTDTSKEIKTRANQKHKPFIAELKVESAERDFVII